MCQLCTIESATQLVVNNLDADFWLLDALFEKHGRVELPYLSGLNLSVALLAGSRTPVLVELALPHVGLLDHTLAVDSDLFELLRTILLIGLSLSWLCVDGRLKGALRLAQD